MFRPVCCDPSVRTTLSWGFSFPPVKTTWLPSGDTAGSLERKTPQSTAIDRNRKPPPDRSVIATPQLSDGSAAVNTTRPPPGGTSGPVPQKRTRPSGCASPSTPTTTLIAPVPVLTLRIAFPVPLAPLAHRSQ